MIDNLIELLSSDEEEKYKLTKKQEINKINRIKDTQIYSKRKRNLINICFKTYNVALKTSAIRLSKEEIKKMPQLNDQKWLKDTIENMDKKRVTFDTLTQSWSCKYIYEYRTKQIPIEEKRGYISYCQHHFLSEESIRGLYKNRWLSSDVLTTYLENYIKVNGIKVNLVSSYLSSKIFDNNFVNDPLKQILIDESSTSDFFCGIVFVNGNNWNCFFANKATKEFLYLDPVGKVASTISTIYNAFIAWKRYYKRIDSSFKWKRADYPVHSIQKDSFNSGVFVVKYLENLLTNKSLIFPSAQDDLCKIRSEMLKVLINLK